MVAVQHNLGRLCHEIGASRFTGGTTLEGYATRRALRVLWGMVTDDAADDFIQHEYVRGHAFLQRGFARGLDRERAVGMRFEDPDGLCIANAFEPRAPEPRPNQPGFGGPSVNARAGIDGMRWPRRIEKRFAPARAARELVKV